MLLQLLDGLLLHVQLRLLLHLHLRLLKLHLDLLDLSLQLLLVQEQRLLLDILLLQLNYPAACRLCPGRRQLDSSAGVDRQVRADGVLPNHGRGEDVVPVKEASKVSEQAIQRAT